VKAVWVKAVPWDKDLVTAALESGADAVVVPEGKSEAVRELGIIRTVAPDGDLKLGEDVVEIEIASKEDEVRAAQLGRARTVIVRAVDWTIIPLENLVAAGARIIAEVHSAEEAVTATQVLEAGTAGVLIATADPAEVGRVVRAVKSEAEVIPLQTARVVSVRPLGMGDRVCVDTCTNMGIGEGMLVGNSSAALFLVHAESVENPYVEPRPFRVNAGAVHAYIRVPGGRTRYLSELRSGDDALVVAASGHTQVSCIGRSKVERRPLLLVTAEAEGEEATVILQNAETVRLVGADGQPVSVVALQEGSEVLVAIEKAGRHFGMKVQETIRER
jgi:3-dehydroquinate synthase II